MLRFIAWIRSLFTRRKSEREIYVYFDGERQRAIDPLVAWRAIFGHPEIDLNANVKISQNVVIDGKSVYSPEEVYEAEDKIRQLTREAFGVKAWTESTPGLTVEETDKLLADFLLDYMPGLKKKRKTLPMMSQASDSRPPQDSTGSPAESPIESPSASGSTASESNDAAPSG